MQAEALDLCAVLAMPRTNLSRLNDRNLRGKKLHVPASNEISYFNNTECRILKSKTVPWHDSQNEVTITCNALLTTTCDRITQRQPVWIEITGNTRTISKYIVVDSFNLKPGQYQIAINNHIYIVSRIEEIQLCELLLGDNEGVRKAWHFEDLFDRIDDQLLADGSRYAGLLSKYILAANRLNRLFRLNLGYDLLQVKQEADKISVNPKLYG